MQQRIAAETAQSITYSQRAEALSTIAAQNLIYPLLLVLRLVIVRNKLRRDVAILSLGKSSSQVKYVIYANHQSKLDPLIICASLPYKAIRHLLPFRFFVENSYFRGVMTGLLGAVGGFPAHYEENTAYGLDRARVLMASNQTIVIFPPGTRTREYIVKSGVSLLATEPNTKLIPVHIDWKSRWHCHVRIGEPINGGVTRPPEQLMNHVYELAERLQ